jgi:alpha-L-rhamnosidase
MALSKYLWLASVLAVTALSAGAASSQEWITAPGIEKTAPVVLHFRRELDLRSVPMAFPVEVSADNRFILYVNGQRVGQGPARGDLQHWRYEAFDLKPFLKPGHNVVAAEVWNAVGDPAKPGFNGAPMAQISAQTGFWVHGKGLAGVLDSDGRWRVAVQPGHTFSSPYDALLHALKTIWYAAGGNESVDGTQMDWNWAGPRESDAGWADAVAAVDPGTTPPWVLVADPLPAMSDQPIAPGRVVRSDTADLAAFPGKRVTLPANTETRLLIDQGVMVAGYPELTLSGGKDARVTITYGEALYDDQAHKGDRNEVAQRQAIGVTDTFMADGGEGRPFRPLWWRTWRYMEIAVKTGAEPLTLDALHLHADAYPFAEKGYFKSSDPDLDKVWDIGWRTLKIDAHETFMDSAYWEQLQYVGDTRLENLIVYGVSGDPRLPAQAIDAFGESARPDGMIQSAYPSHSNNIIPTFGLLWIGMMHDYWMQQPDRGVITRNLPGARKILDWYAPYVAANGLLKRNPEWNFVDWVGDPALAQDKFPSFDATSGTSCLTSLLYLGALKEAADLEASVGNAGLATDDTARARALSTAIQAQCWDEGHGLYADDPSKTIFSQHANALAVLYDVAPKAKAQAILDKVTAPTGIDAPDGILTASYYFSWYLIHAYEHAGLGDRYDDQLQTWRDLASRHFTTWPEQRGNTRSDTHAWSAHPTADLLAIIAGVQPGAPGYASVTVAPHPGALKSFDAGAATPKGLVKVRYAAEGTKATFVIVLPTDLSGRFDWHGHTQPLKPGKTAITVPMSETH